MINQLCFLYKGYLTSQLPLVSGHNARAGHVVVEYNYVSVSVMCNRKITRIVNI